MPDGLPFPEGTVVVKVLTTNAPPDCVPYLAGSPEWKVNRHVMNPKTKQYMCKREVQDLAHRPDRRGGHRPALADRLGLRHLRL